MRAFWWWLWVSILAVGLVLVIFLRGFPGEPHNDILQMLEERSIAP